MHHVVVGAPPPAVQPDPVEVAAFRIRNAEDVAVAVEDDRD
jgi:hypothetical protein